MAKFPEIPLVRGATCCCDPRISFVGAMSPSYWLLSCRGSSAHSCCWTWMQDKMRSVVGRFGITGAAQTLKIKVCS